MGRSKESDWIIMDRLAEPILTNVKGCVVEIGLGPSSIVLHRNAWNFGANYHGCDRKHRQCDWAIEQGIHKIHKMKSQNMLPLITEPIAMAFVDGTHRAEYVLIEVEAILKKLAIGGVMFMHDTSPPAKWADPTGKKRCGNVYIVREDLEEREELYTFTWPYTATGCGLTMVMKKGPKRDYLQQ